MAHGYMGDGYGKDGWRDPDGGDDDGRRDWRNENRGQERGDWRDRERHQYDRDDRGSDRGRFMFEGRDRYSGRDRPDDRRNDREAGRGFFERTADEARDGFRDDEHDYRARDRAGGDSRWSREDRSSRQQPHRGHSAFSSPEHGHYLDWRQQQMDALDRDYQDYCRERQKQFHSDFSSWRQNRQAGNNRSQSGQQPSGAQGTELELSETDELEGATSPRNTPTATVSPTSDATIGSNNSENSMPGRS